ncbi:FecR family protein [Bacteroides fragilis]|uniref:FecR family protein n=1 Tax=Bacteroides fragilis TaxID=817 RepID=UPI00101B6D30|nr:FecR family protein [Bacteroides fragilis]
MKIEKEILYRYFNGDATPEEEHKIRQYLEASDENWKEYLRERKFFDTIILKEQVVSEKSGQLRVVLHRLSQEIIKIAAVFLLALGVSFFWLQKSENPGAKTVMTTLYGQMANVTLPDGTKVWLNSHTRLEYPVTFGKDKREIHMDGEAYFEVVHNAKKPFVVHTPRCESVEVLGTKFYVDAYSDAKTFEAALIEGSVKVNAGGQSVVISPLQRAVFQKGRISVEKITDLDIYRWREGLICFKHEPFTDIVKELEKYYGVHIHIREHLQHNPLLTVKFRLSDGIEYALRVLQQDVPFSYTRDDKGNIFMIQK